MQTTKLGTRSTRQPGGLLAGLAAVALVVAGCTGGGAAATGEDASSGGNALIAMIQEPGSMSPFFTDQSGADLSVLAVEPLFNQVADGSYEPLLAAEVPSVENGGVSEDGLTVTFRLREGITWSDGEPFTAEDLAFTFDAISAPDSALLADPEYGLVDSVTAVDDLTAEVRMTDPNPAYLNLFKQVLPAHTFDSATIPAEHPQARLPMGTGPFVFTEWQSGSQMTLERNEAYWRDPQQPYLDGIIVTITPDKQTALTAFTDGEYDTVFFVDSGDLPDLTTAAKGGAPITVELQETESWVEFLWLNHSDGGDPEVPHPVLGDPAVREAIDLAIDRQAIIDRVLEGFGTQVGSFIYAGFAAHEIAPAPFDPDAANALLDEAGWVTGSDGVRSRDGVRASLGFTTIAGDQTRALYQQLIQQHLADVGVEVRIENVPSNTLFGGFSEGGLLATGDYDLSMTRDGYYIDPLQWVDVFTSDSIPAQESPDGFTYSHWRNAAYDELADAAASTLDREERAEAYADLAELFAAERVALPLYSSEWGWA